jgi:hypothetical protein
MHALQLGAQDGKVLTVNLARDWLSLAQRTLELVTCGGGEVLRQEGRATCLIPVLQHPRH